MTNASLYVCNPWFAAESRLSQPSAELAVANKKARKVSLLITKAMGWSHCSHTHTVFITTDNVCACVCVRSEIQKQVGKRGCGHCGPDPSQLGIRLAVVALPWSCLFIFTSDWWTQTHRKTHTHTHTFRPTRRRSEEETAQFETVLLFSGHHSLRGRAAVFAGRVHPNGRTAVLLLAPVVVGSVAGITPWK